MATTGTKQSKYGIAIIGSGPAGLSAAIRASDTGLSHILIEAQSHIANTAYRYHMGKHIMAEPQELPLYDSLSFRDGKREDVLFNWQKEVISKKVNLELNTEITKITGKQGAFNIVANDGRTIAAETVVLATGNQNNINTLNVDGQEHENVQYTLTDPGKYTDETIIVIGAGDSGIENALALYKKNTVYLVNEGYDFSLAQSANEDAITEVISKGDIEHIAGANITAITLPGNSTEKSILILDTSNGKAEIPFDRIIARLGASTPWPFLKACGVKPPDNDDFALPDLTDRYESNRRGIYMIGTLAGARLIRQCINQGYEVIEHIRGRHIKPSDEDLLRKKFDRVPGRPDVSNVLTASQVKIPLLAGLNKVQLREFFLESNFHVMSTNDYIFHKNDDSDSFFCIYSGEVFIEDDEKSASDSFILTGGQFFGEMSLISGRRRSASARAGKNCKLIETPRRYMKKLINANASVKRLIDESFIVRTLQTRFAPTVAAEKLAEVAHAAILRHFSAGDEIFREGDEADCIHVIRQGSVTVSKYIGGHEVVLSYLPAGNYVGEMGIMGRCRRTATVRAATSTDTIELGAEQFNFLLEQDEELKKRIQQEYRQRLSKNMTIQQQGGNGIISFLVSQGVGNAADVLLIDESLCIRCNNCEKACADVHDGTSRLDLETGPRYASIHVPTSCRHCEHPYCMKDCPPDAISRAEDGEVVIADSCIGCGHCYENCPYGVIQMETRNRNKHNLWAWLLFGLGAEPGSNRQSGLYQGAENARAVKCDMCRDFEAGPACVRSCPTGAALRIKAERLPQYAGEV